jgi:hypothetical protein
MHLIEFIGPRGTRSDISVSEIIAIDGRPVAPLPTVEELTSRLAHVEGRLHTLETILAGALAGSAPDDTAPVTDPDPAPITA